MWAHLSAWLLRASSCRQSRSSCGSPVPACSAAVYFTHGHPARLTAARHARLQYPGLCHTDELSGLYSIHTHLPSGIPPGLGRQFHAHIVLFSVLCVHAYCRLPCNYHRMLGAAMAQQTDAINVIHTQQTAPCFHLLHPNLPPSPDTCCLALQTCIDRHSAALPRVSTVVLTAQPDFNTFQS